MKKIIKDILIEYEEKRNKAENTRKEKIKEVYNVIPRIKEIDKTIQELGIRCTKALLKTKDPTDKNYIDVLKQKITSLKKEKISLLEKYSYPSDFLELNYECDLCKDTGYIGRKKCNCFKQKLIDRAYRQSNLGTILKKENFSTFDINLFPEEKYENNPVTPRENMKNIVSICEGFVNNFDKNNEENLLFYGSTGLGKTFLCNCIAKKLLDSGKLVIYLTAFNLFRILEEYRFSQSSHQQNREQLNTILTCDLLIIDDLGTELSNSFTVSELFNIINTRLLEKRKTIISTNFNLQQFLGTYSQRVFSRISGYYEMLKFYGPDLRCEN